MDPILVRGSRCRTSNQKLFHLGSGTSLSAINVSRENWVKVSGLPAEIGEMTCLLSVLHRLVRLSSCHKLSFGPQSSVPRALLSVPKT